MSRTKIRTARHNIWLTPDEKVRWFAKASEAGLNLNEYIRRCVERRKVIPIQPEVNRKTAIELGRIGVNLNQLVRAMNAAIVSGQHIPNVSEAISVVEEVERAVKTLQLELNGVNERKNS
jgi:Bacterial mobilisation protein (MobC)